MIIETNDQVKSLESKIIEMETEVLQSNVNFNF